MRSPTLRAAVSLLLFSAWMALLFWGFAFGGAVHLLLLGSLALFPWRALAPTRPSLPLPPLSQPHTHPSGREGDEPDEFS